MKLAPRYLELLRAIHRLTEEGGRPPTQAELAAAMNLRSRGNVARRLPGLEGRGLIRRQGGTRDIMLTESGRALATAPRDLKLNLGPAWNWNREEPYDP